MFQSVKKPITKAIPSECLGTRTRLFEWEQRIRSRNKVAVGEPAAGLENSQFLVKF